MNIPSMAEKLDPARCALLVIDVQNAFCHPEGLRGKENNFDISVMESMKKQLLSLLEAARRTRVLRVFVRADHSLAFVSGPYAEKLQSQGTLGKITRDDWEGDYWGDDVRPNPELGEVEVLKHRPTAFRATDMDLILRSHGISTLVLTGVAASGCVMATAMDGFFHDYYVVIAGDAVADRDKELQRVLTRRFEHSYGDVLAASEIASAWDAGSGTAATARS